MTKFCVDCIHHERLAEGGKDYCLRVKPISPITGLVEQKYRLCEDERGSEMKCGYSGYYYMPDAFRIEGHNKVYKEYSQVPDNSFFAYGVAVAVMLTVLFVVLIRL